ncbi:HDOD domain-containing protein [Desulfogranum japonicum]|uniref:HDOD domain-containing protein n=1 Tax=Desulfogranum japonicum TaxID=231447 RepID=UPI0003FD952A|nr:HDOD domain-containing protein [Desulfogranum japonicum]
MAENSSFIDILNKCIESDSVQLPVFNPTALRIREELAKKEPEIKVIEKVINSDQSLSSQVLKIANSSFYRGLAEISSIRGAIMRLGMREIGKIVLIASIQNTFKSKDKSLHIIMKRLWQHSVGCAYGAMWITRRHEYNIASDQVFFAALFHDVGKLFILMVIEHIKKKNPKIQITPSLLKESMKRLHSSEGFKLLTHWNVPEQFAVVARDHHDLDVQQDNVLLLIVRMANMVCNNLGISVDQNESIMLPATLEANILNLSEIDIAELEIYLEDSKVLTA